VLGAEVRLIVNIAPAQRAGIKGIFILVGGAGYHRTFQLGVLLHGNIVAAFTGVQPGLVGDAVVVAVQFILADAQVCRTAARTNRDAEAAAVQRGLVPAGAVAILTAAARVGIGKYAEPGIRWGYI